MLNSWEGAWNHGKGDRRSREVVLVLSEVLLLQMLVVVLDALKREPRRLGRVSASSSRILNSEGRVFIVASEGNVLGVGLDGKVDRDVSEGNTAIEVIAIVEL